VGPKQVFGPRVPGAQQACVNPVNILGASAAQRRFGHALGVAGLGVIDDEQVFDLEPRCGGWLGSAAV